MRFTDLSHLGKALAAQRVERVLAASEAGNPTALEELLVLGVSRVPPKKRQHFAGLYYKRAKESLNQGQFPSAISSLQAAHDLVPDNDLIATRLRLLRQALKLRAPVPWTASLHELQRDLGLLCTRHPCICTSHFQIAKCQGALDASFTHERIVRGVRIFTVAPYHPRSYRGKWTKLLKTVKRPPYDRKPLQPIADIVADFVLEETRSGALV